MSSTLRHPVELNDDEPAYPSPPSRYMSEQDFLAWVAANEVRAEWVEGEVIMMAPASIDQSDLNWWLCTLLRLYVDTKDLGIVVPDTWTRLRVPRDQIRAPDVLFIEKSRKDIAASGKMVVGPPDLIIEVVSHDSQARDWRVKYAEYEAAGVREYWIVDPLSQSVESYVLSPERRYRRLEEIDGKFSSTVVFGWFLRPEWLWQSPRRSVLDLLPELGIKLG